MRNRGQRRDPESGFTLLETLLVVAILVILMAFSMVGVIKYRDTLKITELDNAARDICMAAQNRAVLLQNGGRLDNCLSVAHDLTPNSGNGGTCYVSSKDDDIKELIPEGTIDPTLRDRGEFFVVYEPVSASVTDVFYMEEADTLEIDGALAIIGNRTERAKQKVGYYGSEKGEAIDTKPLPTPGVEVTIENGLELKVTVKYTLPTAGLPASGLERIPSVKLEYDGAEVVLADSTTSFDQKTWVLDSLTTGEKRFKDLDFKDSSGFATTPALGGDFKVTAGLTLKAPGYIDSAYYASAEENSLFDTGTHNEDTAYIANLRHLQNLDQGTSGVWDKIKNAKQLWDINAGGYDFIPIKNDKLTSYDGGQKLISNLTVNHSGSAGLFAEIGEGMTVKGVRLVDAKAISTNNGNAGALAGEVTNATLEDIQVYWSKPEDLVTGGDLAYMVKGKASGGLVGQANETVTIKDSFAATTVDGANAAGGLVGTVSVTVSVTGSYADCYLKGGSAGGLVGLNGGSVTLSNCYAAGFLDKCDKANTAGSVYGSASVTANNVYSAVRLILSSKVLSEPGTLLANGMTDENGTRYLYTQADAALAALGGEYTFHDNAKTHIYDLRFRLENKPEDKLTPPYIFPGLTGLPHYGDWAELTLSAGLAYYEEYTTYKGGSLYGAEGYFEPEDDKPTIKTLRADTEDPAVVKDGYALVFKDPNIPPVLIGYGPKDNAQIWRLEGETWTWQNPGAGEPETAKTLTVEKFTATQGGATYTLIPLPDRIMTDDLPDKDNFYQLLSHHVKLDGYKVTESEREFYFNPHFGRSVISGTVTEGIYAKPVKPDETKDEFKTVYVRTPRHFYDLSRFQAADKYNYAAKGLRFRQELDLDYSAYAEGYAGNRDPVTGNYKQDPIGKADPAFSGVYDGQCHMIKKVFFKKVSTETDFGLFGKLGGGSYLKNVVYEQDSGLGAGETWSGGHVGALVGLNYGAITNCATFGVNLKAENVWMLGGLVGKNEGTIQNCAAEVVWLSMEGSSIAAGGLVGMNSSGRTIENSYAVGRVNGASTRNNSTIGGLVGTNVGNVNNSYAAVDLTVSEKCGKYGLCSGTYKESDGTVNGNGTCDENSGWLDDVYIYRGEKYKCTCPADYEDPEKAISLKDLSVKLSGKQSAATATICNIPGDSSYKGKYEGKLYPYLTGVTTTLKRDQETGEIQTVEATPVHYGLWPVALPVGVVYYEKYDNNSYGIEGYCQDLNDPTSKVDTLKPDTDNPVVTVDGYALVFEGKDTDIPEGEYKVRYGSKDYDPARTWTLTKTTTESSEIKYKFTWSKSGVTPWEVKPLETGTDSYTVFPLPDEMITGELPNKVIDKVEKKDADGNTVMKDGNPVMVDVDHSPFYQELKFGQQTYYFNPYFARTVKTPDPDGSPPANPECKDRMAIEEIGGREMEKGDSVISIRTPRHFYNLSAHRSAPGGYYYLQELDLDYSTYKWAEVGLDLSKNSGYYEQAPINIRDRLDQQLVFTYDGDYHLISNVMFKGAVQINPDPTDPEKPIEDVCTGLFAGVWWIGDTACVLKNAVYKMDPDSRYEYNLEENPGRTLIVGVLVGSNAGIVRNCAVYDVNLWVNQNCKVPTAAVGGLVGRMRGTVSNCSAELADLQAFVGANGFVGGLVGKVMSNDYKNDGGKVFRSYAVGKVTALFQTGRVSGLVGDLSPYGSTITDCYATTYLVSKNNPEKYGLFGPTLYTSNGADMVLKPKNSYWVQGSFRLRWGEWKDYNTNEYKDNDKYKDGSENEFPRAIQPNQLAGKLEGSGKLSPVAKEYNVKGKDYGAPYDDVFPDVSGVTTMLKRKNDGTILQRLDEPKPVHYGLWPVEK